jgi:hypothetical protein
MGPGEKMTVLQDKLIAGCSPILPHSPGFQVMPYRVINNWETYSIVDTPIFTI